MAVELRALRPSFPAEVDGIDLSQPMDAGNVRTIWDAIDRYAVLLFRDQRLTDAQLRDFAAEFGPRNVASQRDDLEIFHAPPDRKRDLTTSRETLIHH